MKICISSFYYEKGARSSRAVAQNLFQPQAQRSLYLPPSSFGLLCPMLLDPCPVRYLYVLFTCPKSFPLSFSLERSAPCTFRPLPFTFCAPCPMLFAPCSLLPALCALRPAPESVGFLYISFFMLYRNTSFLQHNYLS